MKIIPKKSDVRREINETINQLQNVLKFEKWLKQLIDCYWRNNNLFQLLTCST
jgi:hypothetical protein